MITDSRERHPTAENLADHAPSPPSTGPGWCRCRRLRRSTAWWPGCPRAGTRSARRRPAAPRPTGPTARSRGPSPSAPASSSGSTPPRGPGPVDRSRAGSKHHVLTEGAGVPLCASLTGGNRNDVTQLLPLIDQIPPVRGRRGRPRQRPDQIFADRAYDHDKYRRAVRAEGIRPRIARRGTPHGSGLGIYRWVVERTIAWYHGMNRLRIRWERRDDIYEAFLGLATCIVTYRHIARLC